MVDHAVQFLEKNQHRPFALLVHFREPHLPYTPMPAEDREALRSLDPTVPEEPGLVKKQIQDLTREYYTAVHALDRNVGRLLARLETLGLASNTVVLFTSDHGYMIGHHGLHTKGNAWTVAGGLRGPKRPNMFDDSLRVPLLIRWPGVIRPGTVLEPRVSNVDTFATVLGILGVRPPARWQHEGQDVSPLLRGKTYKPGPALFGQYDLHNEGLAFLRMVRTDEWKLVRHFHSQLLDELYDLKADPGETRNLYREPAQARIRSNLERQLYRWQRQIRDPLLRGLPAIRPPRP